MIQWLTSTEVGVTSLDSDAVYFICSYLNIEIRIPSYYGMTVVVIKPFSFLQEVQHKFHFNRIQMEIKTNKPILATSYSDIKIRK